MPTPTQHDLEYPPPPQTVRLILREPQPYLQLWDIGSLSKALQ